MCKLCVLILMCCASVPWSSAAPQPRGEDPGPRFESAAEQSDGLQEEIDGQESILSKVRGNVPLFSLLCLLCFVDNSIFCA